MTDPPGDPANDERDRDTFDSPVDDTGLLALDAESTAPAEDDQPAIPSVDLDERLGVTPAGAIELPDASESSSEDDIAIDEWSSEDTEAGVAVVAEDVLLGEDDVAPGGEDPLAYLDTGVLDELVSDDRSVQHAVVEESESAASAEDEPLSTADAEEEAAAAALAAGGQSRFGGILRRFGRNSTGEPEDTVDPSPPTMDMNPPATLRERTSSRVRSFLDPAANQIDLTWHRRMVGAVLVLVLVLLMANLAGAALIVASAVVPLLIVMILASHDVFERESNVALLGVGVLGVIVGIVFGGLSAWVVGSQWFNLGHLNFGAGGFGGRFAPDTAPFIVWLVCGLLLPVATVAGIAAVPIFLRRWPQFANEVMDGMILSGASAAGVSIGLAATFWWPITFGDGPLMNVSDWTLTVLGQVFLRPLVLTMGGAVIGAGVWRYMLAGSGGPLAAAPAVAGALGIVLLWLGSIGSQASGIWPEFLFTSVLALVMFAIYRTTLDRAIQTDTAVLGTDGERVICPHCHQVTPPGVFCGRCGQPLSAVAADEPGE